MTFDLNSISSENLAYLQRVNFNLDNLEPNPKSTYAPLSLRRMWNIKEVGISNKDLIKRDGENNTGDTAKGQSDGKTAYHFPTENLLAGMYNNNIPIAFFVNGEKGRISINIGTWLPKEEYQPGDSANKLLDEREETLKSVLNGIFPFIEFGEKNETKLSQIQSAGLSLGIPTAKLPDMQDGSLQIDRLIRALQGKTWGYLVLAQPYPRKKLSELTYRTVNEMRVVDSTMLSSKQNISNAPSLENHYKELLKKMLDSLTIGRAIGTWRTAVYLLETKKDDDMGIKKSNSSDVIHNKNNSYNVLTSAWHAIFSGKDSLPESIRVWNLDEGNSKLPLHWAMPDKPAQKSKTVFQYPYEYQTILNSSQLSAYIHLPRIETSGFQIKEIPVFDTVPPSSTHNNTKPSSSSSEKKQLIDMGKVIQQNKETAIDYTLDVKSLSAHTFIAGITGAGKTTTIKHMLKNVHNLDIPFLVIEPAKKEYRDLLNSFGDKRIQIFTIGNENISPFRLNPFEVLPGTPVNVHIDLLRSVFSASFGMWTPLPQILEQCLHRIYEDRGWDITSNTNYRLKDDDHTDSSLYQKYAFPTLSDLIGKVDEVISQSGHSREIKDNMRGALYTRINGLRAGGKGRMLDVQLSIPMEDLLNKPTILELEDVGDDDDKAFIMGLFLIRLFEYRRFQNKKNKLHLMVIEEAHRLLSNVGKSGGGGAEWEANPKGKAVESFTNLLSEIRAYNQGIIISDQVPVKLAPDVIKNTNLKIAHRIVSKEDRDVLGGAMIMNEKQTRSVATFEKGQIAIFGERDDSPVMAQVPKPDEDTKLPSNDMIKKHMANSEIVTKNRVIFSPFQSSNWNFEMDWSLLKLAQNIVEDKLFQETFGRIILSCIENPSVLDLMWENIIWSAKTSFPSGIDEEKIMQYIVVLASDWFANKRGAQARWSYSKTKRFSTELFNMLSDKLSNPEKTAETKSFRKFALELYTREDSPFSSCEKICNKEKTCLYRYAVKDMITDETFLQEWNDAENQDVYSKPDGNMPTITNVLSNVANRLIIETNKKFTKDAIHTSTESKKRAALCFAQQMWIKDRSKTLENSEVLLKKLMELAGYGR